MHISEHIPEYKEGLLIPYDEHISKAHEWCYANGCFLRTVSLTHAVIQKHQLTTPQHEKGIYFSLTPHEVK